MSWSEVSGVEQYLHKDYVVICHFCPNASLFSIRFLSPKKTFIPSYRASFSLKIIGFKCECLNFQVFTAEEAFIPLTSWLPAAFLCEGLMFQPFTSVHLQCEYLKIQPFTLKRYENQQETRSMWRSECFFREIKYVYARVKGYALQCTVSHNLIIKYVDARVKGCSQYIFRLFQRDWPASLNLYGHSVKFSSQVADNFFQLAD